MTYHEHDRGGQEPVLSAEIPPRPEQAPPPSPPASGRGHTPWPKVKERMLRQVQEEYREAGYRQAISDLEAWQEHPPELTMGVEHSIDHLSEQADEYWPQEEIT